MQHLNAVVASVPPDGNRFGFADFQIASAEDAARYIAANRGKDLTPWCTAYRREQQRTLRCLEHEMFDHPVAILIVVSTADTDPIACFQELSSQHHLPLPFHNVRRDVGGGGVPTRLPSLLADRAPRVLCVSVYVCVCACVRVCVTRRVVVACVACAVGVDRASLTPTSPSFTCCCTTTAAPCPSRLRCC